MNHYRNAADAVEGYRKKFDEIISVELAAANSIEDIHLVLKNVSEKERQRNRGGTSKMQEPNLRAY